MREDFENALKDLNQELLFMGEEVIDIIDKSIMALKNQDEVLAREIINNDEKINKMEKNIESHCLNLILRENPVAKDLRFISSVLKVITDLERIGDQGADIAEISLFLKDEEFITPIVKIPKMGKIVISMLEKSLRAFVTNDLNLAKKVMLMDDEVDDLFHCLKDHLINIIYEDKTTGQQALDILMIGKYLERIGDHAENISEWVIYSITGEPTNLK